MIRIGILDTGCNLKLPNIVDRMNFTTFNKYDVSDNLGHGTMITNIINEMVNKDVEFVICKVLDKYKGDNHYVCDAIRYCINCNCNIINCSFGGGDKNGELEGVIKVCDILGIIVVCANGNGDLCYPALYPSTISVGALDENNNVSSYTKEGYDVLEKGYYMWNGKMECGTSIACAYHTSRLVNNM